MIIAVFFDTLNHRYLKNRIKTVIGVKALPLDIYKVFKSVTTYSYVYKTDIAKYYDKREKRYFINIKAYRVFRENNARLFRKNLNCCGIPQGTAMSGVLANIYMIDIDTQINNLVKLYGGMYRRYSDDSIIIIPKNSEITETVYQEIGEKINSIIKSGMLSEQKDKTSNLIYKNGKIYDMSNSSEAFLDYLGFTFDGKTVKVRQRGIYKFERKSRKMILLAQSKASKKGLISLPYKRMILKYCLERSRRSGKYLKQRRTSNFLSYINRSSQIFSSIENVIYDGGKQISKLRRKVIRRYETIESEIGQEN